MLSSFVVEAFVVSRDSRTLLGLPRYCSISHYSHLSFRPAVLLILVVTRHDRGIFACRDLLGLHLLTRPSDSLHHHHP